MPKAAVNEHGHFRSCEHNVCLATDSPLGPQVHSVTEALPVERPSEQQFRLGVVACLAAHTLLDGIRRCSDVGRICHVGEPAR